MISFLANMTRTKALITAAAVATGLTVGAGVAAVNVGLLASSAEPTPAFEPPSLGTPAAIRATATTEPAGGVVETIYQDIYETVPSGPSSGANAAAQPAPDPAAAPPIITYGDDHESEDHESEDEGDEAFDD